jgi:hypothetical protein
MEVDRMSGARIEFGFIPFPLAIVDESADLSLGEYRLLGYLLRHRFRVKSEMLRLTQEDLLRGVKAPSGERRDRGCGITSGRDLKLARERLEARGWLKVKVQEGGCMVYEVCLGESDDEVSAKRTELETISDASAKCTPDSSPCASAKCSVCQCKMSLLPVQNAPEVISREKVKKREEKPSALALVFALPAWIDKQAWDGYEEMRRKKRVPLTDHARNLCVKKLEEFQRRGHDPAAVLNESAMNGWQGLFEPKGGVNGASGKYSSGTTAVASGNRSQQRTNVNIDAAQRAYQSLVGGVGAAG